MSAARKMARQMARASAPVVNGALAPADEIVQLKVLAYDTLAQIEAGQQRLRQISARILELMGAVPPPPPAPAPPES
jgi:hypothetical protein